MKKCFSFLSVMFALMLCVYAFSSSNKDTAVTDVIIELVQVDGSVINEVVKSNVDHYGFYDGERSQIKEVHNLEKLTEVESIEVYNVRNITDWSFLTKLPKLKSLYLSSVHIESLQFVSVLKMLENLDLDSIYISEKAQKQIIDCSKLTRLKSIRIVTIPRITNIPNYVNVTTKPTLSIDNNNISAISENEAKILQQFSSIRVFATPLTPKYISSTPWLKELPISF